MLTTEELKVLAHKAGEGETGKRAFNADLAWLVAFARLIEAAERARCVYWCGRGSSDGYAEHHISVGTPVPSGPNVWS